MGRTRSSFASSSCRTSGTPFASARDARLLCWQLAHNELSMLEAFFQCEADEQTAEHADLFVPVMRPFESPPGTAFTGAALVQEYAQSRDELHAQDLDGGWEPPPRRQAGARRRAPRSHVHSLREHYGCPASSCWSCAPRA